MRSVASVDREATPDEVLAAFGARTTIGLSALRKALGTSRTRQATLALMRAGKIKRDGDGSPVVYELLETASIHAT